jgi:endonuclease/exonuclease/phosphatase family metal-dependent hydrolase
VKDFVAACETNGFVGVVTPPPPRFWSRHVLGSGLLLLSKFPILAHDFVQFDAASRRDKLFNKCAIYAKIRISSVEHLHIILTHLQASYMTCKDHSIDRDVRRQQLKQVADLVRKNVTDHCPVFLCGDFNIDGRHEDEYRIFDEELKIDGFETHDTLFETLGFHPVTDGALENGEPVDKVLTIPEDFGIEMSLDYVFYLRPEHSVGGDRIVQSVSSELAKCTVAKVYPQLSDHYGVSTTINLLQ